MSDHAFRQRPLEIDHEPALLGQPLLEPLSMEFQVPVHGLCVLGIENGTDLFGRHLL